MALKVQPEFQHQAYQLLFDKGQRILFQEKVEYSKSPILKEFSFPQQPIATPYICLNPFKAGTTRRAKENVEQVQSLVIEQDCMSKELQSRWFRHYFPEGATVEVDSGGKSIHHQIRIEGRLEEESWQKLCELAKKVFPFSDWGVIQDPAKLVRNPGGTRDNGNLQAILHCSKRYSIAELISILEKAASGISNTDIAVARDTVKVYLFEGKCPKQWKEPHPEEMIVQGLSQLILAGYEIEKGFISEVYLENFRKQNIPAEMFLEYIAKAKEASAVKARPSPPKESKTGEPRKSIPIPKNYSQVTQEALKGWLDEKLQQVDLVGVVEQELGILQKLSRNGEKATFCCPYHEDKTPSAWISKSTNGISMLHCSACNFGGKTAIQVMMDKGHNFRGAVEKLFGYFPSFCNKCGQEIRWGEDRKPYNLDGTEHKSTCSYWKEKEQKKTRAELKQEREKQKFLEQKEEAERQPLPFTEIIQRLSAGCGKAYVVAKEGIFEETTETNELLQSSFTIYRKVCDDPLLITQRYEDLSGEECYIKLEWNGKQKIVSQDMLCSKNFDKLVKFGIRILGPNSKAMSEYFLAALGQKESTKDFSTRNGWIGDAFVFGNKFLLANGEEREIARKDGIQVGTAGSYETWLETVKRFSNDPQVQISCGASTIAPYLGHLGVQSGTIHWYQDSSVGKSFLAKLAASVWGNFKSIIKSWFGTLVGHEEYCHLMHNLPCFLDEAQNAQNDDHIRQIAYQFANETSKTRGKILEGEVTLDKARSWSTFLISTGERKITDASTQGGLSARVIEIYRRPYENIDELTFTKTERILDKNYGWGGLKVIKYLCENKAFVEQSYEILLAELEKSIPVESNIQKRLLPRWAAIILGAQINQTLFGFHYDGKAIWEEFLKSLGEMENEKPSRNLYEAILELYQANIKRFHTKNPNGEFTQSEETEVWGFFDHQKKAVYFFPRILRRELKKQGFAWSMLAVLKEQGKLIHDSKSFQTMARVLGQNLRFVALLLEEEK